MNRFQKKCFIGSTGAHLLLVLVLFVGPAFLTSSKVNDLPPLDIIPPNTVDALFSGGGNPQARPPVATPTPPVPAPPVAPPPKPPVQAERRPEPVKEPEPPKDTPKDIAKTTESFEINKTTKRKLPNVSIKVVNAKTDTPKKSSQVDSQQQQADAQRRALASAISSTARNLRDDVSAPTTVDTNYGPGGGGEAYANYDQVVKSVYQHAWVLPDTDADEAIVKVRVTIAKDGRVVSSTIVRGSGNAVVDTSIQRTLERVTFVAPFPEGAKDKERTFPLSFSLKAKRLIG